ncbi:MAG: hypothetical protein EBX49_01800 [Synechococcaceae bacterium WB8_1B_136]|nr:hypothetical protein [Synechococcaceae bacterium WB8_1B_136]
MTVSIPAQGRFYRLIDARGLPHAELDHVFDSLEEAHAAALAWCEAEGLIASQADASQREWCVVSHFGLEVSTPMGDWRTLRHAGLPALG